MPTTRCLFNIRRITLLMISMILLSGCYKMPKPLKKINEKVITSLDFTVENKTKRTIYITCFYYAKTVASIRWEWRKTPVYKMEANKISTVHIGYIPQKKYLDHIFGYLAIFNNLDDAEDAIYELLPDENKVDLDKLNRLKDKKITLYVEQYGTEEYWYYRFDPKAGIPKVPELDFVLENDTGKNLYVTLFTYEIEEGQPQWDLDKNKVLFVEDEQSIMIDVDTLLQKYTREHARGYLGIFNEDEKKLAEKSTFETLKPNQKINLGILYKLQDKKVVLVPKRYGIITGFDDKFPTIEFAIQKR